MEGRDLQYDTCLSPTSARARLYLADGTEWLMRWGQAEARSEVAVRVANGSFESTKSFLGRQRSYYGKAKTYRGIRCSNPFFLTQSSDLGLKVGGPTVHFIAHGALTFSWLFDSGSSLELQTVSMWFWYMRMIYICNLESSSHHTKSTHSNMEWETESRSII